MKMLAEKKAQNSMETLVLIGGAILVAVTVGLVVKQVANQFAQTGTEQIANSP